MEWIEILSIYNSNFIKLSNVLTVSHKCTLTVKLQQCPYFHFFPMGWASFFYWCNITSHEITLHLGTGEAIKLPTKDNKLLLICTGDYRLLLVYMGDKALTPTKGSFEHETTWQLCQSLNQPDHWI